MKLFGAALVFVAVVTNVWAQSPVVLERTAQNSLKSKSTGRTYDIKVSLPRDYEKSGKSYPVLYALDGWHFALMNFIQDNAVFAKKMPPVIMVVVGHGDLPDLMNIRAEDFLPPNSEPNVKSGRADRFLDFVEHELIPFTDKQYRTTQTDRALLGHSFGGTFALYALTERPALFQRIVCASPALPPPREQMLRPLGERLKTLSSPVILDLSVGTEEDKTEDTVAINTLLSTIKPAKLRYRLTVFNGENHNSVRLSSFPSGLYWIYQ